MRADALQGRDREEALALAQRLKHDLGKYVSLRARWLDDTADPEGRREALRTDLLETRRGVGGVLSAAAVWAPYEAVWTGREPLWGEVRLDCSDDEDVEALMGDMARLGHYGAALPSLSEADMEEALATAARVTLTTQRLVRRLRGGT